MVDRRLAGIKDVLTLVDLAGKRPAAHVAAEIAAAADAHLLGLAPSPTVAVAAVAGGALAMDLMADLAREAEDRASAALGAFEALVRQAGVSGESGRYRFADGHGVDLVARARLADIAVAGQEDPGAPEPGRSAALEALLFDAGVPVLVVPYVATGRFSCRRVAVAWDGSLPAARAVRAALPFLAVAEAASVIVVEAPDTVIGDDLALYLARHGVAVTVRRVASGGGDVGSALLNEASDGGAELLVMGAYGRSRLRELLLGGTTRTLLTEMTLPTLMAH